ncbi:hypothetical protein ACFQ0G_14450 [Streptomyces chiangmaiensis]
MLRGLSGGLHRALHLDFVELVVNALRCPVQPRRRHDPDSVAVLGQQIVVGLGEGHVLRVIQRRRVQGGPAAAE